jgi:excisionase family DNA binding protein
MVLVTQIDQSTSKKNISQTMPDLAEFMITDQAAKALGFTVDSVRNLVYKKKLQSTRFGRSVLHDIITGIRNSMIYKVG